MKKSLSELVAMKAEAEIVATEATIKNVANVISGDGQYGHYTFQDIVLEDGGTIMTAVLSNCNEFGQNMIGKRISMVSSDTKHGSRGVKLKNRKGEWILYISKTAVITDAVNMSSTASQPTHQPAAQQPAQPAGRFATHSAPTPPPAAPQQSHPKTPEQNADEVKECLERFGNFYQLAMEEANAQCVLWNSRHPEMQVGIESFMRMCAGFSAGGEKVGLQRITPTGDVTKFIA